MAAQASGQPNGAPSALPQSTPDGQLLDSAQAATYTAPRRHHQPLTRTASATHSAATPARPRGARLMAATFQALGTNSTLPS